MFVLGKEGNVQVYKVGAGHKYSKAAGAEMWSVVLESKAISKRKMKTHPVPCLASFSFTLKSKEPNLAQEHNSMILL